MKTDKIKLFDKQPTLDKSDFEKLRILGLLVPEKTPRIRSKQNVADEITNPTAGEVVSYSALDRALQKKLISQDNARRLLVIETVRTSGTPRETHIRRLMVVAFAGDKSKVEEKIYNISSRLWPEKKQK